MYYNRGLTYAAKGDYDRARAEDWGQALRINPGNVRDPFSNSCGRRR